MNIQDFCRDWGIPLNKIPGGIGQLSDGYHTFDGLYHQRCILFAALCNTYPELAWKSRKHSDGELPFGGGWFIVGIDTPEGQYTYHYKLEYWDMFKVEWIDLAKVWDGHTENHVARLLSLPEANNKRMIGIDLAKGPDTTVTTNMEAEEEESTQSSWAKREIEIACNAEREIPHDGIDMSDYVVAYYESALRAFESLCGDGHSGFSIGMTKHILNKLLDGKPLTPIVDTDDVWSDISDMSGLKGEEVNYQCKRMSSLFKYVYADGTVKYKDINRCIKVDIDNGNVWHSGLVDRIIDDLYPITMPYSPGKAIKVYCNDFLTDHKNGDFDTMGIFYAIKDEENIQINRYFKDAETETGWTEIDKEEYEFRKELADALTVADKARAEAAKMVEKSIYGITLKAEKVSDSAKITQPLIE